MLEENKLEKNKFFAILIAVFVTLLWASSYILNKIVFNDSVIGPLTLSGLRYFIASITIAIAIFIWRSFRHERKRTDTIQLNGLQYISLGFFGFFLAQGMQYVGQFFITPTQTSLILCLGNILIVLFIDVFWLKEIKNRAVYYFAFGVAISVLVYYYPWNLSVADIIGVLFVLLSSVGYAIHLSYSRHVIANKQMRVEDVVVKPMLIGAFLLLVIGFSMEPFPTLTLKSYFIILWLGVINGGVAFYLWGLTQKFLKAYESSMINNLILIEVALMDIWILHSSISITQAIAICFTAIFIVLIQFVRTKAKGTH